MAPTVREVPAPRPPSGPAVAWPAPPPPPRRVAVTVTLFVAAIIVLAGAAGGLIYLLQRPTAKAGSSAGTAHAAGVATGAIRASQTPVSPAATAHAAGEALDAIQVGLVPDETPGGQHITTLRVHDESLLSGSQGWDVVDEKYDVGTSVVHVVQNTTYGFGETKDVEAWCDYGSYSERRDGFILSDPRPGPDCYSPRLLHWAFFHNGSALSFVPWHAERRGTNVVVTWSMEGQRAEMSFDSKGRVVNGTYAYSLAGTKSSESFVFGYGSPLDAAVPPAVGNLTPIVFLYDRSGGLETYTVHSVPGPWTLDRLDIRLVAYGGSRAGQELLLAPFDGASHSIPGWSVVYRPTGTTGFLSPGDRIEVRRDGTAAETGVDLAVGERTTGRHLVDEIVPASMAYRLP